MAPDAASAAVYAFRGEAPRNRRPCRGTGAHRGVPREPTIASLAGRPGPRSGGAWGASHPDGPGGVVTARPRGAGP